MSLFHRRPLQWANRSVTFLTCIAMGGCGVTLALAPSAARAQSQFPASVLAAGPAAYFRLGSTGAGSSVNGYTTTFGNGAVVSAPGGGAPLAGEPSNAGAQLPGASGNIVTTSLGAQNTLTGAATITGWVNLAQLPSVANRTFYVAGKSQSGNDLDLQFQSDNRLYFFTDTGSSTSFTPAPGSLVGQWHFVAAAFDTTANVRELFWDGALVASSAPGGHGPSANPFTIGYSPVFGGREFSGGIDEVAVFSRRLSASEVSGLYQSAFVTAAVPEPGTLALSLGAGLPLMGLWLSRRNRCRSSTTNR